MQVIPRQLCDNAGFDATDVLNKLRQKHALADGSGRNYGVDVNSGGVVDTYAAFVWEPALVKLNAIQVCAAGVAGGGVWAGSEPRWHAQDSSAPSGLTVPFPPSPRTHTTECHGGGVPHPVGGRDGQEPTQRGARRADGRARHGRARRHARRPWEGHAAVMWCCAGGTGRVSCAARGAATGRTGNARGFLKLKRPGEKAWRQCAGKLTTSRCPLRAGQENLTHRPALNCWHRGGSGPRVIQPLRSPRRLCTTAKSSLSRRLQRSWP
jgi:hypothetical protein